jgi:hypothetical protein
MPERQAGHTCRRQTVNMSRPRSGCNPALRTAYTWRRAPSPAARRCAHRLPPAARRTGRRPPQTARTPGRPLSHRSLRRPGRSRQERAGSRCRIPARRPARRPAGPRRGPSAHVRPRSLSSRPKSARRRPPDRNRRSPATPCVRAASARGGRRASPPRCGRQARGWSGYARARRRQSRAAPRPGRRRPAVRAARAPARDPARGCRSPRGRAPSCRRGSARRRRVGGPRRSAHRADADPVRWQE